VLPNSPDLVSFISWLIYLALPDACFRVNLDSIVKYLISWYETLHSPRHQICFKAANACIGKAISVQEVEATRISR